MVGNRTLIKFTPWANMVGNRTLMKFTPDQIWLEIVL